MSNKSRDVEKFCKIEIFIGFFSILLYNIVMKAIIEKNKIEYNKSKGKRDFITYVNQIKKRVKIRQMLSEYIQHGNTSVYIHSRNVAYLSYKIAKHMERKFRIKINYEELIVGAMFHDFFLYDWHDSETSPKLHGYKHPAIASKNAQEYYDITENEKTIIENHMWPLTITKFPKSTEAFIVCMADKCCSIRETIHRH